MSTALSTTVPLTSLFQERMVNFGPLTTKSSCLISAFGEKKEKKTKLDMCVWTHQSQLFLEDHISAPRGCCFLKFLHVFEYPR